MLETGIEVGFTMGTIQFEDTTLGKSTTCTHELEEICGMFALSCSLNEYFPGKDIMTEQIEVISSINLQSLAQE